MAVALLVTVAGGTLVRLVFGDAFSGSAPALRVMAWTAAVVAVGHNWAELAIASRQEKVLLKSVMAGAAVSLLAGPVLIRWRGVLGAAVGNLLAEVTAHTAMLAFAPVGWRLGILRPALGPSLACAGAIVGATITSPFGGAVAAATGVTTYVVGLLATRTWTLGQLRAALEVARRVQG
jgi:O-antigen/teichoic acid export membrane protein